ncbi:MAG: 30S ribosomal protein S20 [Deltaproteobacteria bacterium]|nr:30S ribosomal protein S20 [Deltaproteobacteria bacterium]
MANHKSAIKRARQNEVRRMRNTAHKTRAKTAVRAVRAAVAGNDPARAQETLKEAVSLLQKIADKGAIHKKKASRRISRLSRAVNRVNLS